MNDTESKSSGMLNLTDGSVNFNRVYFTIQATKAPRMYWWF